MRNVISMNKFEIDAELATLAPASKRAKELVAEKQRRFVKRMAKRGVPVTIVPAPKPIGARIAAKLDMVQAMREYHANVEAYNARFA